MLALPSLITVSPCNTAVAAGPSATAELLSSVLGLPGVWTEAWRSMAQSLLQGAVAVRKVHRSSVQGAKTLRVRSGAAVTSLEADSVLSDKRWLAKPLNSLAVEISIRSQPNFSVANGNQKMDT